MKMVKLDFIKGISEGVTTSGEKFIGAVEDKRIEFKPEIKGTLEKDVASMANLNQITYYIIGPTSEGGGKKDYISGFRDVKTEKGDVENKIEKLINPPHFVITPFIIEHEGKQYHQYKIEIWPSRDVCGIPGKTDSEGFLIVKYPRRYDSKTYAMTTAEANRVSQEKKIFRDAAEFFELLQYKVERNEEIIQNGKIFNFLHLPEIFDYPTLGLNEMKAIFNVADIIGENNIHLKGSMTNYRNELPEIRYYHEQYLYSEFDAELSDSYYRGIPGPPRKIDGSKLQNVLRRKRFFPEKVPKKMLQSLNFLEPYTRKR